MTEPVGEVVTFYSYKGGTGRTMLLANVAWILASGGKRVLMIDWDLEAPGLHRYFHPFLIDKDLTATDGLIDLVTEFSVEAVTPPLEGERSSEQWHESLTNILRYAITIDWSFPAPGSLFVPAGRQGTSYAGRVNTFDWRNFYERLQGAAFLEALKQRAFIEYGFDYILIDSRTGVSDTSGICTVQLPETLVVCFALNRQNIEGGLSVAYSVEEQWTKLPEDIRRRKRIFPVITRVELSEQDKLQNARDHVHSSFVPFLEHFSAAERETYWGRGETLYVPYYAYEEVLAVFGDKPKQSNSLLAACEAVTGYVSHGDVEALTPTTDSERQTVLSRFARKPDDPRHREFENTVYIGFTEDLGTNAHELKAVLETRGMKIHVQPDAEHQAEAELENSQHAVFLIGREYSSKLDADLRQFGRQILEEDTERTVVPMSFFPGHPKKLPTIFQRLQIDVSRGTSPEILADFFIQAIGSSQTGKTLVGARPLELELALERAESEDPLVRVAAANVLGRIGGAESFILLLSMLRDPSERVCGAAKIALLELTPNHLKSLGSIGFDFVEALTVHRDKGAITQSEFLDLLTVSKSKRALRYLLDGLSAEKADLRRAVTNLGRLRNPAAAEFLLTRLEDPDQGVVEAAAVALCGLEDERVLDKLLKVKQIDNFTIALGMGHYSNPGLLKLLFDKLSDRHFSERVVWVLKYMNRRGDRRAVDGLLVQLEREDPQIRRTAINALRQIGDARAVDGLLAQLDVPDTQIQQSAINALGQIGDTRAIDGLLAQLDSEGPQKLATIKALGQIRNTRVLDDLIPLFDHQTKNVRVERHSHRLDLAGRG